MGGRSIHVTIGDGKAAARGGVAVQMPRFLPRIGRGRARAALRACRLAAWWKAGRVGATAQFTAFVPRTGAACAKACASALRAAADTPAGRSDGRGRVHWRRPGLNGPQSGFEEGAMIAFGVQDGKHHWLVVNHLIEYRVRKPSEVGPAPVAEPDAVAQRIPGNPINDAVDLIYEIAAQPRLLGSVPARFALDVRSSERMPSGCAHPRAGASGSRSSRARKEPRCLGWR